MPFLRHPILSAFGFVIAFLLPFRIAPEQFRGEKCFFFISSSPRVGRREHDTLQKSLRFHSSSFPAVSPTSTASSFLAPSYSATLDAYPRPLDSPLWRRLQQAPFFVEVSDKKNTGKKESLQKTEEMEEQQRKLLFPVLNKLDALCTHLLLEGQVSAADEKADEATSGEICNGSFSGDANSWGCCTLMPLALEYLTGKHAAGEGAQSSGGPLLENDPVLDNSEEETLRRRRDRFIQGKEGESFYHMLAHLLSKTLGIGPVPQRNYSLCRELSLRTALETRDTDKLHAAVSDAKFSGGGAAVHESKNTDHAGEANAEKASLALPSDEEVKYIERQIGRFPFGLLSVARRRKDTNPMTVSSSCAPSSSLASAPSGREQKLSSSYSDTHAALRARGIPQVLLVSPLWVGDLLEKKSFRAALSSAHSPKPRQRLLQSLLRVEGFLGACSHAKKGASCRGLELSGVKRECREEEEATEEAAPTEARNLDAVGELTPFPTTFWLSDPVLCAKISEVETTGFVKETESGVLRKDSALQRKVIEDNMRFIALRWLLLPKSVLSHFYSANKRAQGAEPCSEEGGIKTQVIQGSRGTGGECKECVICSCRLCNLLECHRLRGIGGLLDFCRVITHSCLQAHLSRRSRKVACFRPFPSIQQIVEGRNQNGRNMGVEHLLPEASVYRMSELDCASSDLENALDLDRQNHHLESQLVIQQRKHEAELSALRLAASEEVAAMAKKLRDAETARSQLEALNQQEKEVLRNLEITDRRYQELSHLPDDAISLKDFVQLRVYELIRPYKERLEALQAEILCLRASVKEQSCMQCELSALEIQRLQASLALLQEDQKVATCASGKRQEHTTKQKASDEAEELQKRLEAADREVASLRVQLREGQLAAEAAAQKQAAHHQEQILRHESEKMELRRELELQMDAREAQLRQTAEQHTLQQKLQLEAAEASVAGLEVKYRHSEMRYEEVAAALCKTHAAHQESLAQLSAQEVSSLKETEKQLTQRCEELRVEVASFSHLDARVQECLDLITSSGSCPSAELLLPLIETKLGGYRHLQKTIDIAFKLREASQELQDKSIQLHQALEKNAGLKRLLQAERNCRGFMGSPFPALRDRLLQTEALRLQAVEQLQNERGKVQLLQKHKLMLMQDLRRCLDARKQMGECLGSAAQTRCLHTKEQQHGQQCPSAHDVSNRLPPQPHQSQRPPQERQQHTGCTAIDELTQASSTAQRTKAGPCSCCRCNLPTAATSARATTAAVAPQQQYKCCSCEGQQIRTQESAAAAAGSIPQQLGTPQKPLHLRQTTRGRDEPYRDVHTSIYTTILAAIAGWLGLLRWFIVHN
ncbi:hypothetical protein cyc_03225 [Cyclospora cayetanensis]|uniref:Uncharacterized protein n=1 Tax=Cyclospora cayetanensis TaxID=88456 RepID=A0A1D3CV76_9EIME|nr:hypothetical protein cyc_03225 [Cyclospora cayetanensis]